MIAKSTKLFLICLLVNFFLVFVLSSTQTFADTINATVKIGLCGDGFVDTAEQCDGSALNNASCTSRGFSEGSLSCGPSCEFNTSSCTNTTPVVPPSSGGGGGGGGGSGENSSSNVSPRTSFSSASVGFFGRSSPRNTITFLKDAQVVGATIADSNADFKMIISDLSPGNYNFSIYTEDNWGIRSSLHTFPVSVTSGVATNIGDIFIAPTISTDKSQVKQGDNISIFGQSTPLSDVVIHVNSDNAFTITKKTDANGVYLLNFDTSVLEMGQHNTKSKASHEDEISSYSKVVSFSVGDENILAPLPQTVLSKSDINNDKKVNLIDFSVAAYWYNRPNPPKASDLNGDGKVTLVDFSIMAYNWTG